MKFVSFDVDKKSSLLDLYTPDKTKSNTLDINGSTLARIMTMETREAGLFYNYGKEFTYKYLNEKTIDTTSKTIAAFATYFGITIQHNFSTAFAAKLFQFKVSDLASIMTECWITILTENDVRFYKPEILSISRSLGEESTGLWAYMGRVQNEISSINFDGETSGTVLANITGKDTIIPDVIETETKNQIINTLKACGDIIYISTKLEVNPMDYVIYNSFNYLIVSAKYSAKDSIWVYTCVREYKQVLTFSAADIYINAWHSIGASGEPAFENSWSNIAGMVSKFRKRDNYLDVWLGVSGGANGTTIFTLTSPFRPSQTAAIAVSNIESGSYSSQLYILNTGIVKVLFSAGATKIYINHSFLLN